MRTLEELDKQIAELNTKIDDLTNKRNEIINEVREANLERQSILMERARKICPFKDNVIYLIGGERCKVAWVEMSDLDELHISFMRITKKGEFNKRAYPHHLYIKTDLLPKVDTSTGVVMVNGKEVKTCHNILIKIAE